MNSKVPFYVVLVFLLLVGCQKQKTIDFNSDIKPIINKKCISCNDRVKKNRGFSLLY